MGRVKIPKKTLRLLYLKGIDICGHQIPLIYRVFTDFAKKFNSPNFRFARFLNRGDQFSQKFAKLFIGSLSLI